MIRQKIVIVNPPADNERHIATQYDNGKDSLVRWCYNDNWSFGTRFTKDDGRVGIGDDYGVTEMLEFYHDW